MSWTDIRKGMAKRLRTIPTLNVYENTPGAITEDDMATVQIGQPGIGPAGHSDLADVYVRVVLIVSRAVGAESERRLDAYLWPKGPLSVIAAVCAEPTLGGAVDTVTWMSAATPYGAPENANARQSEVMFRCGVRVTAPTGEFSSAFNQMQFNGVSDL